MAANSNVAVLPYTREIVQRIPKFESKVQWLSVDEKNRREKKFFVIIDSDIQLTRYLSKGESQSGAL